MNLFPATHTDIKGILSIYNKAVLTTTATFDLSPQSYEDRLTWFNKLNGQFPIYVFRYNEEVIGFGAIGPFREKEAYKTTGELSVYISPNYSGQGLATKMIEHLVKDAPRYNLKTIVSVITTENSASIHIHQKLGFNFCGTLHRVGYKFEKWLDVAFYEMQL